MFGFKFAKVSESKTMIQSASEFRTLGYIERDLANDGGWIYEVVALDDEFDAALDDINRVSVDYGYCEEIVADAIGAMSAAHEPEPEPDGEQGVTVGCGGYMVTFETDPCAKCGAATNHPSGYCQNCQAPERTPLLALPAATGTPEERRATLERAFDSNAERLAYNYGAMRVDPAITAIQAALTDAISDQWHEAVERRADWLAAA